MLKRSILCVTLLSQLLTSVVPVFASGGLPRSLDSEEAEAAPSRLAGISSPSAAQPLDWNAINQLWYTQDDQRDQNRESFRPLLLETAQTPGHPDQRISFLRLWNFKGAHQEEDREKLRPMLLEIAQDPVHPFHWEALRGLWHSGLEQQEEDRTLLYPTLLRDAQNHRFPRQLYALLDLSILPGEQGVESRDRIRPTLLELAQRTRNPHSFHAAVALLWMAGWEHQEENRAALRPILMEVAQMSGHPFQRHTIRYLREYNDPEAQDLGRALQLQYFPVQNSAALRRKINWFNQGTFKAHAREPLADLSADSMDLVREFTHLMSAIDPEDETSPFYLEAAAITGEAIDSGLSPEHNQARLQDVQRRALGFLKYLTGQPLEEGEDAGWQMYENNKLMLINALKHIVDALNREEDPQMRLNNLGIVLNGILYCPTGQAEGINSAVNTLIYGQNRLSGDVEQKLHELVQEATYSAFLRTFHRDGGAVHSLARARTVLEPHIGISQALTGFVERIARVDETEVPGILEEFYLSFTRPYLIDYLARHVQTAEDVQRVMDCASAPSFELREQIRRDKEERPLLNGELVRWLVSHEQAANLTNFGFDWEGNGVLSQNGIREILKILRYIRS